MPPEDELFARQMYWSGDQIRRHQLQVSRGSVAWYVDFILSKGGPSKVMCTTPLPMDGHFIELCMTVAIAQLLGAKYENMALVELVPDPENPKGLQLKPLCNFVTDDKLTMARAAATPPIPLEVMDKLRVMLGLPTGELLHPDNRK